MKLSLLLIGVHETLCQPLHLYHQLCIGSTTTEAVAQQCFDLNLGDSAMQKKKSPTVSVIFTLVKSPTQPVGSQPLAALRLVSYSGAFTATEVSVPASTIAAVPKEERRERATAVDVTARVRMLKSSCILFSFHLLCTVSVDLFTCCVPFL